MKYFKTYESESAFTQVENEYYITSVVPGVGIVGEDKSVKYNRGYESMTVFYRVSGETGVSKIYSNLVKSNLIKVIVDHKEVPLDTIMSSNYYTFGSPGVHTIIYIFTEISNLPQEAFGGCNDIFNVTFSDSTESMSYGVFIGCEKLARTKPIVLPRHIKRIGISAFMINIGQRVNRTFVCLAETPPTLGGRAFCCYAGGWFKGYTTIYVPYGCLQAYKDAGGEWWYEGTSPRPDYYRYNLQELTEEETEKYYKKYK